MVNGFLALLYFLLDFHGGRQGSGPEGADDLWYHTEKISFCVSTFLLFFVSSFLRPLPSWLAFQTIIGLQTL